MLPISQKNNGQIIDQPIITGQILGKAHHGCMPFPGPLFCFDVLGRSFPFTKRLPVGFGNDLVEHLQERVDVAVDVIRKQHAGFGVGLEEADELAASKVLLFKTRLGDHFILSLSSQMPIKTHCVPQRRSKTLRRRSKESFLG